MRSLSEEESDNFLDDSADDLSSNTGDLESVSDSEDFEFLSRSSSHAQTDEGEDTDSEFAPPHTPSVTTGSLISYDDNAEHDTGEPDADGVADSLLPSFELPRILSPQEELDDSTATITRIPRERRDTVTQVPKPGEPESPPKKPFHILYAGSTTLKSPVLRKLAQALMAATLKDKSDTPDGASPSSTNAEWSSGITSVVPITDFDSSDVAPEVEFVEDSLVKMRITDIHSISSYQSRRATHFQCTLNDNTQIMTCCHYRRAQICSWYERMDEYPSLVVYCSQTRGETPSLNLQKIAAFADMHHIPLLVIS